MPTPNDTEANPKVTNAATVIVGRDTNDGPSVLMVRRNSKTAFGGMWVFPGGKVDPEDYDHTGDLRAASRQAAVREAKEEADLDLHIDDLVEHSYWAPPLDIPRRFLTWFYVAHAPDGTAGDVTIDGGEITDHLWLTPTETLRRHSEGEIELAPPTFVTLSNLVQHASMGSLVETHRSIESERFLTKWITIEGGAVVMWADDAGYDTGNPDTAGPRHRVEMRLSGWTYLRSI